MPFDPTSAKALDLDSDRTKFDPGTAALIERPGVGRGVKDLGIDALGGAVSATGYLARGVGELAERSNLFRGAAAPLRGIGDVISGTGESISKATSPEYQQAKDDSRISGDILAPSTWDFGDDPNFFGIAGGVANTVGQVAPMLASAYATRGKMLPSAAVGSAVTAGAQGQQEEQRINTMNQEGIDALPGYQKLIAAGVEPAAARAQLARSTGNEAAVTAAPLGALDALTQGLPFLAAGKKALSGIATSRLGRTAAAGTIGAVGEGLQEVAENAATVYGANRITGEDRSLTEDSFGNFIGGALAGGGIGAAGGALSPDRVDRGTAPQTAIDALDMLATGDIPDTRIDDLVPGAAQNDTTVGGTTPPAPEPVTEPAPAPAPPAPPAAPAPIVDPGERTAPGPVAGAVPPVPNTPSYEAAAVSAVGFVPDPARGPLSRAVDTALKTGVIAVPGAGTPATQPLIVPGTAPAAGQAPVVASDPQSLRNRTIYDGERRRAEEQEQIAAAEAKSKPRTRVQAEPQFEERLSKLNTPFRSEVGAKAAAKNAANAGFDVFKRAPNEWILRRQIPGTDPNALPPSAERFNTQFSNQQPATPASEEVVSSGLQSGTALGGAAVAAPAAPAAGGVTSTTGAAQTAPAGGAQPIGLTDMGNPITAQNQSLESENTRSVGVAQKGEWESFDQETGTLGIPRAEMPQIKGEHRGALVNYLGARGVKSESVELPAADLKPTQAEFSLDKVRKAADRGDDRSILISSDGHVLDGHHQWLAKLQSRGSVKAIRLDAPIKQLLKDAREFPSSTTDGEARFSAKPVGMPALRDRSEWSRAAREFTKDSAVKRIVYHATSADVTEFDPDRSDLGTHFGTVDQANKSVARGRGAGAGPNIMPVYMDIRTPLRLKDVGSFHADAIAEQLVAKGIITKARAKEITQAIDGNWALRRQYNKEIRAAIEAAGYDGVVYKNTQEGDGDSYIAFRPTQIKSATGNSGAFDPSNPDIRFSERVEPEVEGDKLTARVKQLEAELRTDELTGLRNKRAFDEDAELGWSTVGALDMDGLKRLNDTIGHKPADKVLTQLGAILGQAENDGARFYHLSGDEFAARFRGDKAASDAAMAALQAALDNIDVEIDTVDADGAARTYVYEGIGVSYGTGETYEIADHGANANKQERLAAGKREDARGTGAPRRLRETTGRSSDRREADSPEAVAPPTRERAAGPQTNPGMRAEVISRLYAPITKNWTTKVNVVATPEQFPDAVRAHPRFNPALSEAVIHDGQIYIAASMVDTVRDAYRLLAHEGIAHAGVEGMVGKQGWPAVVKDVNALLDRDSIRWLTDEVAVRYPNADADTRAAEAIALMAERGVRSSLMSRLIAGARKAARALGVKVDFSESDLREMIADAARQMNTGKARAEVRFSNGVEVRELEPGSLDFSMLAGLSPGERASPAMQAEAATMWRALGTNSPHFRRWFGVSRVKKADGTPIPMYHGTTARFDAFDPSKAGKSTGFAASGLGIFTTPKRAAAERYAGGGEVLKLYVRLENPYIMPLKEFQSFESVDGARARQAELIRKGYDGVFIKEDGTTVVFEPNQVKAADNLGTFSISDDRLRFRNRVSRDELSTRVPTAKKATETALDQVLVIGLESMKADPKAFAKNVELVTGYPNYRATASADTIDKQAERFIEHAASNLLWLHDEVEPKLRARAQRWYDGARAIAERWATKYGISEPEAAGVMAVLSPQKDWFMNVSLAERVLDVMTQQQDSPWTAEMAATAARIFGKEQYAPLMAEIRGKKLSQLTDPTTKAMWVRIYDEAYNPRAHRIITPEGDFADFRKTGSGKNYSVAWGSLGEIGKAISIIDNPSLENISAMMGEQHKVRNFYNNIVNPNSDAGHVTIDTHAVAAALLRPLAGASTEVAHNFGGTGSASSSFSGSSGTYGLYAEAYRRAAKRRGILPRQMQSITWEAVRGLFSPSFKSQASNVEAIDEIWNNYRKGRLSLENARTQAVELAGGITDPDWAGSAARDNEAPQASSYQGGVSGAGVPERGAGPAASRSGGGAAEGAEVTRFSTAAALRQRVDDLFYTTKTFNAWHKSVGTQYHKAQVDADFRKVYEKGQDFLADVSRIAMEAADAAPSLLPKLDGLADILKRGPSKTDIAKVSGAVFTGTLTDEKVYSDSELRGRFGLSDKQVGLYREFRAAVDKSLDELNAADISRLVQRDAPGAVPAIRATPAQAAQIAVSALQAIDPQRYADTIKEIDERQQKIDELKIQGYAPLMRFGKYTVYTTGANGDQVYFGTFEREVDATRMAREMREQYPTGTTRQGVMAQDSHQMFKGLSLDTLELFADKTGMSAGRAAQDFLRLAKNNRSAMKRLIHRKGVAGFENDAARVLAAFITSNARAASSAYNLADMSRAVEAIPKEKGDVKDEAARLALYLQNPQEEAAALRGLLFTQFIGGSIASAMLNMTQPVMMTLPWLSSYVGAGKAAKALASASAVAVGKAPTDPGLRAAMARATKDGVVAPHEIHNLYAESIRSFGSSLAARRGLKVWGSFFSLAEAFNRRVTFAAAYRAAADMGQAAVQSRGFKDAYDFAVNAVEATQGVYNRGNRPDWARGALGATLFTFKQYSISYMEFLKRLPMKERALALSLLVLASGLQGLPGADDLEDIIDTVGQSLGWNTNSKKALRESVAGALGEDLGALVTHGLSSATPIDIQQRLGIGNLIPGTGLLKKSNDDKGREIAEALGPAGGLAKQLADAYDKASAGDWFGAAKSVAPLAAKNLAKGIESGVTGEYRDERGRKVIDVTTGDAVAKAIGFQPANVARTQRVLRDAQQDVDMVREMEAEISDQWAKSAAAGDRGGIVKALAQLREWNAANPESPIRINPNQIKRRVLEMRMSKQQRFLKSTPKEMRAQINRRLQQIEPEEEEA